jgi:uncharacterized repeat protein (TIGR01451 family)
MLTLANIPADQMIGYGFSIGYNDVALTRAAGTQGGCRFGMAGVPPAATGPSPYLGACINLPGPGTPTNACSPGPCNLSDPIIFTCNQSGVFPLDLDATTAEWYDTAFAINPVSSAVDGTITCDEPAPDVIVEKLADPNPSPNEGIVDFTIRVRNIGQVAATAVFVADLLPPGTTFLSAPDPLCFPLTGGIACGFFGLDPDDSSPGGPDEREFHMFLQMPDVTVDTVATNRRR